jgi:hypothetical protein
VEGTGKALELLEVSVTLAPPVGAAALRVSLSVAEPPPITVVGLTLTLLSVGLVAAGLTVKLCETGAAGA